MVDTALTGHDLIQSYLKTIDSQPGVYRMLNATSEVLYVGKARNLRARVSNYARPTGHSARIARMISETSSMMFLTVKTETEALLLEQNLIKQLKPRYNVLLRDDKSFPNILINTEHPFPQLQRHRGKRTEKGSYFGPFASAGAVHRTINQLQKVFLLRNCSDAMFDSRSRPCLQYQIKRCAAPCVGKINQKQYAQLVGDAERFLSGKSTAVQANLVAEMGAASESMEFERAAALRDRIRALTTVQQSQGVNPAGVPEADVIALHLENGQACVQVFFIRANQNWGNRDFYPRTGSGADEAEILEAFLGQFYDGKEPARLILLSHPSSPPPPRRLRRAVYPAAGRVVSLFPVLAACRRLAPRRLMPPASAALPLAACSCAAATARPPTERRIRHAAGPCAHCVVFIFRVLARLARRAFSGWRLTPRAENLWREPCRWLPASALLPPPPHRICHTAGPRAARLRLVPRACGARALGPCACAAPGARAAAAPHLLRCRSSRTPRALSFFGLRATIGHVLAPRCGAFVKPSRWAVCRPWCTSCGLLCFGVRLCVKRLAPPRVARTLSS